MRHEETVVGEEFKVTTVRDDGGGKRSLASTTITFEAFGQVFIVEKRRGGLLTREEIPAPMTLSDITAEVAKRYGVTALMIRNGNKHRTVKEARWMVIYLARKRTTASYPDIASFLGQDHATVFSAYKNMERRMSVRRQTEGPTPANGNAEAGQACAQMNSSAPSDVRAV